MCESDQISLQSKEGSYFYEGLRDHFVGLDASTKITKWPPNWMSFKNELKFEVRETCHYDSIISSCTCRHKHNSYFTFMKL